MPQVLAPVVFVRPDWSVSGLPERLNPPLVNRTEASDVAALMPWIEWAFEAEISAQA